MALTDEVLAAVIRDSAELWEEFRLRRGGNFSHLIPADLAGAASALRDLRPRADSFLELGSGVGSITILADLLGFDAHGIEIEPELIETSRDLAERFGAEPGFAEGSFVPPAYREDLEHQSADFLTLTEGADAYAELGLGLADFDLVYGYPWPGEEDWMREMLHRHGGPDALFLTYSARDGFDLIEQGRPD